MANESLGKARDQIFRKININEEDKREERGAKSDDSTQRSLPIASHEEDTHRAANSDEKMREEQADEPRAKRRDTSSYEEQAAQSDACPIQTSSPARGLASALPFARPVCRFQEAQTP